MACVFVACLFVALSFGQTLQASDLDRPAVTTGLVEAINGNPLRIWTASLHSKFSGATLRDVRDLCGAKLSPGHKQRPQLQQRRYNARNTVPLPVSFDWRHRAAICPSILEVRDQANCGNCWAVSSASVLSDRVCLASNGTRQRRLSGQDVTSCTNINGCEGADLVIAWEYIHKTGVVSGGPYGDSSSCFPYQLPHCTQQHGTNVTNSTYPPCDRNAETPACPRKCGNSENWSGSKAKSGKPYYLTGEADMMQELVQHGPLTVTFSIYDDFPAYQRGVYDNTSSRLIGGHAVGLYGYGVEDGTKYWLLKNQWNVEWGEAGWFRVIRGKDACDIERGINYRCRPTAAQIPTHEVITVL